MVWQEIGNKLKLRDRKVIPSLLRLDDKLAENQFEFQIRQGVLYQPELLSSEVVTFPIFHTTRWRNDLFNCGCHKFPLELQSSLAHFNPLHDAFQRLVLGPAIERLSMAFAGLGIAEQVTSPTFTIVREYPGPELALLHLDVYRLDQLREVQDLGVGEMLDEEAVMLVEWGDAVLPALGEEYLEIRITFGAADDDRILELHPSGSSWLARTRVLGEAVERWSTGGGDASC